MSQAWNMPSQVRNLSSQASNLPSNSTNQPFQAAKSTRAGFKLAISGQTDGRKDERKSPCEKKFPTFDM